MNQSLMTEFKEDLKDFREMTEKFYAKEVSVKDYKGFSGGFGSYAQRGAEASMLRLRMPGGRITKEKLKFLVDAIAAYDVRRVHLTTCQTVQFHDLGMKAVCDIMEQAMEVGIVTRGGGGDFPRNVMVSPLSGVEQGEYFDVLPYAERAGDYLMGIIKTVKLPRKLKVGFSNSPANVTHATFRDLGFVAKENGRFDVYSAGGLGNNYKMGVKVAEDVKPEEVLYYVEAMVRTFTTYGNYESRAKSRTRYMQETTGTPGSDDTYTAFTAILQANGGFTKDDCGKDVIITYYAQVKAINNSIASDLQNTASVKVNDDSDIPGDRTDSYTYGIQLTKTLAGVALGQDDKDDKIDKVYFDLYEKKNGIYEKVTDLGNVVSANKTDGAETQYGQFVTTKNNPILIKGLSLGEYALKETKTVGGYTLLTKYVEFNLVDANLNGKLDDAEGNDTDSNILLKTVDNKKGFSMPGTGGMGTYIFTIGGLVVMAGAVLLLVSSKKKRA